MTYINFLKNKSICLHLGFFSEHKGNKNHLVDHHYWKPNHRENLSFHADELCNAISVNKLSISKTGCLLSTIGTGRLYRAK